jgi:homoserine/homoserine lactone efflux protein
MELQVFLAFFIATTIMILSPGPSVFLTVAHSISFGWQRGLFTVGGATAGIAVQLFVAAIGLASLLNTVAGAFEWLRWLGAAYLIYLGIKQWRNAGIPLEFETAAPSGTNLFVQGLVTTIPNPKSLIFIAAFLPQFIDTTRPLGVQFAVIVPTFLFITFFVTSIWALVAGKARGLIHNETSLRTILRASGGLMIVAGLGLALARKKN